MKRFCPSFLIVTTDQKSNCLLKKVYKLILTKLHSEVSESSASVEEVTKEFLSPRAQIIKRLATIA